jgi:hypothetical protein
VEARPRVTDGGNGLQIWRVAVDILNKESRTAKKGLSEGLTTPHRKKNSVLRNVTQGLRKAGFCEHSNEPSESINGEEFVD